MPPFTRCAKWLFPILTVCAAALLVAPYAHFQEFLAQGDHGRDLYAAQAVYRGELPYKDFWWVYGPLMPYYYGLFYKIFGVNIASMILGKLSLTVLAGLLIYLAMAATASPVAAFLTACWFVNFHQDFFFTYNHIGGIAMILAVVFCLLSYIQNSRACFAYGALGCIFILGLIKINFGIAALAVCLISVALNDRLGRVTFTRSKKIFYALGLIGIPLLLYFIYWSLLKNLSVMEIRQCLPYVEGDQPYSTNPWVALNSFMQITVNNMTSNGMNFAFGIIVLASVARTLHLFVKNKLPAPKKPALALALMILSLFYAANFHEYLKSGVWYRSFWSQPLSIMISFLCIDIASQSVPKAMRIATLGLIGFLVIFSWQSILPRLNAVRVESQHLSLERADIYLTNQPQWIQTVSQTTAFLNKTLKGGELFFALPYDALYYFLTGKKTPTRQLIFFEHIKIPPEQERAVIAELEKNNVHYVLLSSRAYARLEPGLGILGKTYCPLIGAYIQKYFIPIAHFGDWGNEPGWAWNHGTLILKRKPSQQN